MIFSILSSLTILVLCLLSTSAVIYNDVYDILKLKNNEETNVNLIKFEKCILPYKNNSQTK